MFSFLAVIGIESITYYRFNIWLTTSSTVTWVAGQQHCPSVLMSNFYTYATDATDLINCLWLPGKLEDF